MHRDGITNVNIIMDVMEVILQVSVLHKCDVMS